MEDTHVWVMNADGSEPREVGEAHRQPPGRAAVVGGRAVGCYFTVQERGDYAARIDRRRLVESAERVLIGERGSVGAWSIGREERLVAMR